MSENGEKVTPKVAGIVDDDGDAKYHVRLVHRWLPLPTTPPLDENLVLSFFGLQLELRGTAKTQPDQNAKPQSNGEIGASTESASPARKAVALHFNVDISRSSALLTSLEAITGPFEIVIAGKVPLQPTTESSSSPSPNEQTAAALQQTASVQTDNTLLEINGERFLLDANITGAEVYRRLQFVANRASLATPYELTFRRHNLGQVSAKIVPFARRRDVQDAQIAQLTKIAAEEAALPLDIRCKKLFLIQQLDFEREHYLVAYLGAQLQELHTQLMSGDQWQAYEFAKTLWYFHAPTARLCAQHPLRGHPEIKRLVTRVQEQVQQAVRRIQRRTRSWQRRKKLFALIQQKMQRQKAEKQRQRHQAARRIQHRVRVHQRRRRFLATVEAVMKQQQELRRQQRADELRREELKKEEQRRQELRREELRREELRREELRREELRLEELRVEEKMRRKELRAEEKLQLELLKNDRRRLQQELDDTKLELQELRQLKEARVSVQLQPQTSSRREEESAIEQLRKQEQQRVQQRLDQLELDLRNIKQVRSAVDSQIQTNTHRGANNYGSESARQLRDTEQQQARQRIEELELKLRQQGTKMAVESVTQTEEHSRVESQDESVGTGNDLEWQHNLTLLRAVVKNKKKNASPKNRHTQTDRIDDDDMVYRSAFRPSVIIPRKPTGEWSGTPSWYYGNSSNYSSNSSLLSLKSSIDNLDDLDVTSQPIRSFESFFASDMAPRQPPPSFVELPWRQDSTFLPLKSSRKLVEITPLQPQLTVRLREYEEPIRPIRPTGNSLPVTHSSPGLSPTKLPYITIRQRKAARSP
ncbi:hypothetical protein PHYBOEH_000368 [Phytophthora boehmeriae]|uniref:Uncharacterized protein n=1 Tax=Phytophthora boehmeriae TaxID=109152 RepID=A0A8T1WU70_9STRA|nr:hypothetical protein PHYBOEH_000368 [Phytophthora boehmeriae]